MEKVRDSNIELLRILCMFGVIINHALQNLWDIHTVDSSLANNVRILIMNASIVAVNCFVFISGYFRIKQSWKGFFSLYTQMLFYMVLALFVGWIVSGQVSVAGLKNILFPLTGNSGNMMWFIPTYFALFLLSPILNKSLDAQDVRGKHISVALLLLVDVYVGYMHQVEEVTINGYHIIHFITLYYIGACLNDINICRMKWGGDFYFLSSSVLAYTPLKWYSRQ